MQASVTRVNRTYYSDLNSVFHCEVTQEDQGSFDLCTVVHNWLRCITQSLHFPLNRQDIDYCQRQDISIGSSYITTAGRSFLDHALCMRRCRVKMFAQKDVALETSWLGRWADVSMGFLLVALGSCVRAGCNSPCLSSLRGLSSRLFMHIISSTCLNLWSSAFFLHSVNW